MPDVVDEVGDRAWVEGPSGQRMYVDPADARARELLRSGGGFSAGSTRLWRAALGLEAWDVVVDVGVNYGEMLLHAEVPAGARRIGFEPNPRVLPYLRRSIEESGLDVELREVALGATEAEASFVVDTEWSGRSGLAHSHRTDAAHELAHVTVPVRTLDDQLDLRTDDSVCIKVDVEGAEFEVLAGAGEVLSDRPWAVMVEVLHMDPFEKARLAEDYVMRVLDVRTEELLVVPPASADLVAGLLDASWLHSQDVLLSARVAS